VVEDYQMLGREKDPYEANVTQSFMQILVGGRSVQNESR
jgi:hypothetical protein